MPARFPSIRLKAYRRGQQDVEYLTLWSQLQERAAMGGRPAGASGVEAGRHAPGDGIHRRRRRRPHRLRSTAPARRLGLADRDRRGTVARPIRFPGASSSTSARRGASRSEYRRRT